MTKIAIIGAGSYVFAWRLIGDFLTWPSLQDSEIALMDINEQKLDAMSHIAQKMVGQCDAGATVLATTELKKALDGADYVFTTIRASESRSHLEIPAKYGISQTVGDTSSVGAIFYFLRHAPIIVNIAKTMEEVSPDGLMLNYTNPMGMLSWAINRMTNTRFVGLCHSVQGTAHQLTRYINAPFEEISYWAAGINHMTWFLKFEWKGKDAYPLLWKAMESPEIYAQDPVRWEVMRYFGGFPSESSGHCSEYLPYFRRTPELIALYSGEEIGGKGQPSYLEAIRERWASYDKRRAERAEKVERVAYGDESIPPIERSNEYGSRILNAMETNEPFMFNGNVPNTGLITNLVQEGIVEVPVIADGTGLHPCYVGKLPPALAALNRMSLNLQELAVKGFVEKDRESIYRAAQVEPLAASKLSLPVIREMVDEMFAADKDLITI